MDVNTFTYDAMERLLNISLSHDGADAVTLSSNTYDAVGRLASCAVNDGGSNTSYAYNVRGWMQSVTNNHFYQWLHYQDAPAGGTPCFNGNISGITWLQRESMKAATSAESVYRFQYDGLNRLTQATYASNSEQWNGDLLAMNDRNFSCTYAYDLNSNMTALQRYGVDMYNTSLPTHIRNHGMIDNLTMTYDGNRLKKVTDQCEELSYAGAMDFKDGADGAEEYTYDANGNMTSDRNKGISSITYNMLNLPQTILFNDGHETRYTYAADGRKLRVQYLLNNFAIFDGEEAEDGGEDGAEMMPFSLASTNDFVVGGGSHNDLEEAVTTLMVRDYCGNKEYRNGVLDKIHNDYGYWHDGGYFFYVKDYRGDVRVVLDQNNQPVELNSYYPYGSLMAATNAEGVQSRKYGTKELDRENGLDWYDSQARMYDPMIGRTTSLDPKAEDYYPISPYLWCGGNPVVIQDPSGMEWTYLNGKKIKDHSLINVYIFYDPKSFDSQTKAMYKLFEEKYGEGHVAISRAITTREFSKDWSEMSSKRIEEVDLNYHGNNQTLILDNSSKNPQYVTATGDGKTNRFGNEAFNVQDLNAPKGNISCATLNINSCHSNSTTQYSLKGSMKTLMKAFYDQFDFKTVRGTSAGVSYNRFTKMPEPQHFWQHWDYMGESPKYLIGMDFTNTIYFRTGGMR